MSRILSGIQPTGSVHLGNYLGAIRNWVSLQEQHAECLYFIADLHAITVPQDPKALITSTYEKVAAFIACGLNPDKAILFVQSHVRGHAELGWILGCHTPLGWLNRMTQFKEKAGKQKDMASLGLYGYPALQAADILLYKSTHVPVGEDQKQHLELARDIAGAFNRFYGAEYFPLPEPQIMPAVARIMSLRDGTKKMSKSDESDYSRINLTDDADTIAKKFQKAKSDAIEGISFDEEKRPEVSNLIQIYAGLSGQSVEAIATQYASSNFSTFKKELADLAVSKLAPITTKMRELSANQAYLDSVLKRGAERANALAEPLIKEVKHMVGFL